MILFYLFSVVCSKTLQELSNILNCETCEYKGTWNGNDNPDLQNQFDFLTEKSGDSFMLFLPDQQKQDKIIQKMKFELLNPKYQELRQVLGDIKLKDYDEDNMYFFFIKFKKTGNLRDKKTQITLVFINIKSNTNQQSAMLNIQFKYNSMEQILLKMLLQMLNYNPQTQVNVKLTSLYNIDLILQIIYGRSSVTVYFRWQYALPNLFASLVYARVYWRMNKMSQKYQLFLLGISLFMIRTYVCRIYILLQQIIYFQYFILPAFFYFMLATTCDMKLIWILWRSRHMAEIVDQQQMRKAITIFFAQFYFSLIGYFILMYFFELENWFICLTGLVMIPQVIHNIRNGNNPKFINAYIFGILCPSMLYPIYARGCPSNIRGMEPSNTFIMVYFSLYLFQILLLYIQYKLGPRAFIPRCFLPKQFQYYHVVNLQEENDDECAICLGSLLDEPAGNDDPVDAKLLLKQIMITPCSHKFHISCLKSWIDVKLQCPTCRSPIPPIAE